jgi:hypothetical protein
VIGRLFAAAAAVLVLALPASPAQASSIYSKVLHVYEARGSIPPCQFSSQQLETALKGVNTYGAQYFADFTAAVQTALTARASGACLPSASQSAPPLGAGRGGQPALKLGPVTAATDASLPAPVLAMAALAALLVLVGAGVAIVWWRGWSPRWVAALRHGFGEAGYRAGGTWQEFEEWLRSK